MNEHNWARKREIDCEASIPRGSGQLGANWRITEDPYLSTLVERPPMNPDQPQAISTFPLNKIRSVIVEEHSVVAVFIIHQLARRALSC